MLDVSHAADAYEGIEERVAQHIELLQRSAGKLLEMQPRRLPKGLSPQTYDVVNIYVPKPGISMGDVSDIGSVDFRNMHSVPLRVFPVPFVLLNIPTVNGHYRIKFAGLSPEHGFFICTEVPMTATVVEIEK